MKNRPIEVGVEKFADLLFTRLLTPRFVVLLLLL